MTKVTLCHKCSGVLASSGDHGLNECQCISGWVRGSEREMEVGEAATAQIQQELRWMAGYISQGRGDADSCKHMLARLLVAMKASSAISGWSINWKLLGTEVKTTK